MSGTPIPGTLAGEAGRPAAWRALHESAVVCTARGVGSLRVTGPDRADFLHGQLAHDVRGLPVGGARRSLLLDAKGHARAETIVHRREDDLHLAVEDGALAWVEARLRAHVVFDQVTIEALPERLATLTLQGVGAREILAAVGWPFPEEDAFVEVPYGGAGVLLSRHARSGPGGVDLHLLRSARDGVARTLADAGAMPASEDVLEPSRVAAGRSRAGREAGEGVLPQEAGLEEALSTRKGCYLGQEIMARIEARGRLRRGLSGLYLATDVPWDPAALRGTDLLRDGRVVGRIGGSARHPELGGIALAVLRHDVGEDEELAVGEAGDLRAVRAPLPFPNAAGA